MLKAVLFDLDQTLIDWSQVEPWEAYQLRRLTRLLEVVQRELDILHDAAPHDLFEHFRAVLSAAWKRGRETFVAPDIRLVLVEMLQAAGAPADRIVPEMVLQVYDWNPPLGERAYTDVLEVLPQFETHGIELGLITNASHPMTIRDRELQMTGLLDLFPRCRLSAVDVGVIKPHRAIFERGLAMLGVRPDEAVFVGDSLEADVRGAQGVGMYAVWIARDDEVRRSESDVVPDAMIETLHELPAVLDGWYPDWRDGCAQ